MADTVNYQCPKCQGPLVFSARKGKLLCKSCQEEFEPAAIEALFEESQAKADKRALEKGAQDVTADFAEANVEGGTEVVMAATTASEKGMAGADFHDTLVAYTCHSCGAQLVCEDTTAATACPYCGNPALIPGKFVGKYEPDKVIPFKKTKEDLQKAYEKHVKGKYLVSKALKQPLDLNGVSVQGVYVPFWLFDASTHGDATYEATSDHSHRVGDDEIIETKHYDVFREATMDFAKVPVDASSKMPDDLMDSLEPYKFDHLKAYSPAYMPGYLAQVYDESPSECFGRCWTRIQSTTESVMRNSVSGYSSVYTKHCDVKCTKRTELFTLLPVYTVSLPYKGTNYLLAMNGQTGKMVGNLPVSVGRCFAFFGIFFAAFVALMIGLFYAATQSFDEQFALISLVVSAIAALVVVLVSRKNVVKNVATKGQAGDYLRKSSIKFLRADDIYRYTTRRVIHHEPPKR